MLLVFGIAFAIPAEDSPETPYDESEALPYDCAPQIATVMSHAAQSVREDLREPLTVRTVAEALFAWVRPVAMGAPALAVVPSLSSEVFPIRC